MMSRGLRVFLPIILAAGLAGSVSAGGEPPAQAAWPKTDADLWPVGALEKSNLDKPRAKAPFDLTGTWTLQLRPEDGGVNFLPLPKLTPAAQASYDAGIKANADGKSYKDDPGQCWPYGMPRWLTRVWPIQFMQYPTMIVAVQGLFNSVRWIYLDGRGHQNPDLAVPSYNGDSVARWEGDTLVIDTNNFEPKHHWAHQGIPISDKFHMVERIRMAKDGRSFTDDLTMTDPVNWVGEWKSTKTFVPVKGEDTEESHCLPDGNDHILAAKEEEK